MQKRWVSRMPPEVEATCGTTVAQLAAALSCSPLIARLLANRHITDTQAGKQFLAPALSQLADPRKLNDCEKAAQRIVDAIRAGQRIVIYGDYDVDGVTATAILFHTLKAANPDTDVRRYIPHRIDEGYGLNTHAIESLINDGAQLIISVDCGITAVEPAAVAKSRDIDLIITDHHAPAPGNQLPDAFALIHPALRDAGCGMPLNETDASSTANRKPQTANSSSDLCGAGVAYKLAWQIARCWCGSERVSETFKQLLVDLLSLAALGTIADVVPLIGENRVIAHHGLGRIKRTPFEGLNALIDHSRLRDEKIDAYHVGFVLGPRLNACGRMGHAKSACKLLTTAQGVEASQIAALLQEANNSRQATERDIFNSACRMVEQNGYDRDDVRIIVLADPAWHAGVVGIVCSRLVNQYGRPAILLNSMNGIAHGSGRSIDGFDLHAALAACGEHLHTFGGHAMAAGMKLATENIENFRGAMIAYAADRLSVEDLTPTLAWDAEAMLHELTVPVVSQLRQMEPFGRGNPSPAVLVRGAKVSQEPRTVGKTGQHLTLVLQQDGQTMRGIAWRMGRLVGQMRVGMELDLIARPKLNEWNGRVNSELEILDLRVAEKMD